jgi:putative membrane protein
MGNPNNLISEAEHKQISDAVRAAEKSTSGEIFTVVAQVSDDYFFVSGFFAGLWSLLLGLALIAAKWFWELEFTVEAVVAAQLVTFFVFMAVLWVFPWLRLWFVPQSIAYRRASANAVRQFLAHGIHGTTGRSGVLLFVSVAEHYAEVIADEGINAKVEQHEWNTMVAELTEHAAKGALAQGFLVAIGHAERLLAEHFPPGNEPENELDDKLVEL